MKKYLIIIVVVIAINISCKEKYHEVEKRREDKSMENNLQKLSKEDLAQIKSFLLNHITSYKVNEPDIVGRSEDYSKEPAVVRIDPDNGYQVPIIKSINFLEKYKTQENWGTFYYEFPLEIDYQGGVNITKNIFFKTTGKAEYKYGVLKEDGKWKIYADGNQPLPVPVGILIDHYKSKNNDKLVNELEAWKQEIEGKK